MPSTLQFYPPVQPTSCFLKQTFWQIRLTTCRIKNEIQENPCQTSGWGEGGDFSSSLSLHLSQNEIALYIQYSGTGKFLAFK